MIIIKEKCILDLQSGVCKAQINHLFVSFIYINSFLIFTTISKTTEVCVTMEITWLPWGCLTWCVASPVRWHRDEGVHDSCPSLEEGGDHLQPLWAQQLEQLEGESGGVSIYTTNIPPHTHPNTYTHPMAHQYLQTRF